MPGGNTESCFSVSEPRAIAGQPRCATNRGERVCVREVNKAPRAARNVPPRRAPAAERPGPLRASRPARPDPTRYGTAPAPATEGGGAGGGGRARRGLTHLVAPLEHVLVAVAQGAVDVEKLEDAVPPHVLSVAPRLLPAQRRALRQQPHDGREAGRPRKRAEPERTECARARCARCGGCARCRGGGTEPGAARDGGRASGRDSALSAAGAAPAAPRAAPGGARPGGSGALSAPCRRGRREEVMERPRGGKSGCRRP